MCASADHISRIPAINHFATLPLIRHSFGRMCVLLRSISEEKGAEEKHFTILDQIRYSFARLNMRAAARHMD